MPKLLISSSHRCARLYQVWQPHHTGRDQNLQPQRECWPTILRMQALPKIPLLRRYSRQRSQKPALFLRCIQQDAGFWCRQKDGPRSPLRLPDGPMRLLQALFGRPESANLAARNRSPTRLLDLVSFEMETKEKEDEWRKVNPDSSLTCSLHGFSRCDNLAPPGKQVYLVEPTMKRASIIKSLGRGIWGCSRRPRAGSQPPSTIPGGKVQDRVPRHCRTMLGEVCQEKYARRTSR